MNSFLLGIILGLTITISFGPGFMALFQTSLLRGLNAGMIFATGMLLSDLTMVGLCYYGLASLSLKGDIRIMGIVAGGIFIAMGGFSVLKTPSLSMDSNTVAVLQNKLTIILAKGFLINSANPFSLIFWIGITGFASKNWGLHSQNVLFFFSGVFITAFSTDILKCYLSGLLRKMLASNAIYWINKTMGFVFIGIGFYLIYKVY